MLSLPVWVRASEGSRHNPCSCTGVKNMQRGLSLASPLAPNIICWRAGQRQETGRGKPENGNAKNDSNLPFLEVRYGWTWKLKTKWRRDSHNNPRQ